MEAWKPQVTRLFGLPEHEGFLIRWTHAYTGLSITRLGVHISPVLHINNEVSSPFIMSQHVDCPQPTSHLGRQATSDIFVYFPIENVKEVETDAGLQNELQVPLVYPSSAWKGKVSA